MEKLKQLFNIKTFKDKRNEIFEEFYNKVQNIGDEREKLTEKYIKETCEKFIKKTVSKCAKYAAGGAVSVGILTAEWGWCVVKNY